MKHKILLPVFFSILLTSVVSAQTIVESYTINQKTREHVGFVNIGVVAQQVGTVSNTEGYFELEVGNTTDSVQFSAIGYDKQVLAIKDILTMQHIELIPKVYELENINVEAKKSKGRDKRFGLKKKRYGGSGFGKAEPGDEIGAVIKIKSPVYIKSANFMVGKIYADSLVLRLNIYDYSNEKLGDNLIKKEILISDIKDVGFYTVDISDQNIILKDDVMFSLEYIYNSEKGYAGIHFGGSVGKNNFFLRSGSNSKNVNGEFVRGNNAAVSFFLTGRELKN